VSGANQEKMEKLLRSIDVDNEKELEKKAATVRTTIESSSIPPPVAREISESYHRLSRLTHGSAKLLARPIKLNYDNGLSFPVGQTNYRP